MGMTEERTALLMFGTAGVDKLQAADAALDRLEHRTGTMASKTSALAEVQRLGGEKMAKYSTGVAALTGNMQNMGVQGDALSKSFGIVGDAIAGTLGPGGIAFVAIGAFATLVGTLVAKQRELKEATAAATKEILEQAAKKGISDPLTAWILGASEGELTGRRGELQSTLARLNQQRTSGISTNAAGWQWENAPSDLQRIREDASKALVELAAVNAQIDLLSQARWAGRTMPEVTIKGRKIGGPATAAAAAAASMPYGPGMYSAFGVGNEQVRMGSWADPQVDAAKQAANATQEAWVTANENILGSFNKMSVGAQAAYRGMQAGTSAVITATSRVVQAALMRENTERLRGVEVVKFTAAMGAAAMLQSIGDVAKQRAIEATAQGFLRLGFALDPAAGAAASFKAAGMYALLAGGAYGAANAASAGAERDFQKSLGKTSYPVSGGDGSSYMGSTPGAMNAAATATPQNIYYQAIWNQYGTVVYGQGGLRDWVQRDLAPELRRLKELGQI